LTRRVFYNTKDLTRREELNRGKSENILPLVSANANTTSANTTFANTTSEECLCVDCKEDEICGGLWHGDRYPNAPTDEEMSKKKIHVVVSHCLHELSWIKWKLRVSNLWPPASIHVISKCNKTVEEVPEGAIITRLPNVGRCDHSYAHYITTILEQKISKEERNNSIVLFLKDDMSRKNYHQGGGGKWSSFEKISKNAFSDNGFGCGVIFRGHTPAYRKTGILFNFDLKEYKRNSDKYTSDGVEFQSIYKNLGAYYKSINGPPTPHRIQVCYGGIFAASVSNILKIDKKTWEMLENTLTRGNNIEESHFAERCWAFLLGRPLQPFQLKALDGHRHQFKSKDILPLISTNANTTSANITFANTTSEEGV